MNKADVLLPEDEWQAIRKEIFSPEELAASEKWVARVIRAEKAADARKLAKQKALAKTKAKTVVVKAVASKSKANNNSNGNGKTTAKISASRSVKKTLARA
ncbi:MAG: hypothetical protein FWE97_01875 [Dehalococcoidia bacterium]|nr:hypothetical protein [Dehalococcoidia bacterium]